MTETPRQRSSVRANFDAYFENCPSRKLLERVSEKWVVLVMTRLEEGSMRYSELTRAIPGVSQKMLTQTLRSLERDGLVTRDITPSVPPRVDYELTALGHSLSERVALIKAWAEDHILEIERARSTYDATKVPS